eukprot:1196194-Prorocentrum_minimum.AAC.9
MPLGDGRPLGRSLRAPISQRHPSRPGVPTCPTWCSVLRCSDPWTPVRLQLFADSTPRHTNTSRARHGHCRTDRQDLVKPSCHWKSQFSHDK